MARKESKKAIYAKHGITFENDHILYNGKWIKPLLKEGNDKVGRTVWTFSLPAGTAGSCICDCKGCYAKNRKIHLRKCYRIKQVKHGNCRQ